ncbi:MAG: beta-galactosidase, partial [Bacteroidota bacterium]
MKKLLFLFTSIIYFSVVYAGNEPEWNNVKVLQINREKPHTTMMVYENIKNASNFDKAKSQYLKNLNGNWKFNWVRKPADRPVDFYKTKFDDSAWKTISVPSNWQMEGYGTPI